MYRKVLCGFIAVLFICLLFGCSEQQHPPVGHGIETESFPVGEDSSWVAADDTVTMDENTASSVNSDPTEDLVSSIGTPHTGINSVNSRTVRNSGNETSGNTANSKPAVNSQLPETSKPSGNQPKPIPPNVDKPIISDSSKVDPDSLNFTLPYVDEKYGIRINDIICYEGYLAENGKNTEVHGSVAIEVENISKNYISWVKFELTTASGKSLKFDFSYMKPGAIFLVQENQAQAYDAEEVYDVGHVSAGVKNDPTRPWITEAPKVSITHKGNTLIAIQNNSTIPIKRIKIFYKNKIGDKYAGGITYIVEDDTGLQPKEILYSVTRHFLGWEKSEIMHVIVDYDLDFILGS